MSEQAIDAGRPIVDPHLHLWDIPEIAGGLQQPQTFLVQDATRLIAESGHRVTHTVYVECHAMYRRNGPAALRSLGETEFATGMAAMSASGQYGPARIADRIVASVDLDLGEGVAPILDLHTARAGERLRGIRVNTAFSEAGLFGASCEPAARTRLQEPAFATAARVLAQMGLSLDVWCLHPQLPHVAELARQVPDLVIVLDHVGTPDLRGLVGESRREALADWRRHMEALAREPNVRVKISGLSMALEGPLSAITGRATSAQLAQDWNDRVETIIGLFGPGRCMFASNYPAERSVGNYGSIWNAFKRLSGQYSEAEQDRLFRMTAVDTYRIDLTGEDHGLATAG